MSVNVNESTGQVGTGNIWFQNAKTSNVKGMSDLQEEVRNTPDSEKKDLGVIVEISKDSPNRKGYRKRFSKGYKMVNVENMAMWHIGQSETVQTER